MFLNYFAATCWICVGILNYPVYKENKHPSWFTFYAAIFCACIGCLKA